VSIEYIQELQPLGYHNSTPDELVTMRIHDVSPDFIHRLQTRGMKNLSIDQMVNLRIHGIVDEGVEGQLAPISRALAQVSSFSLLRQADPLIAMPTPLRRLFSIRTTFLLVSRRTLTRHSLRRYLETLVVERYRELNLVAANLPAVRKRSEWALCRE
jgi:hypothetical protein